MKRGVNKAIIVGNLGKDPDVRYMPNGMATATLTVATSETWKDKSSGQDRERTEWHRIVLFGKLAEIAGEYLIKGAQAYFEGELRTRKWTNQQGQDQYTTEIVLQGYDARMQILSGARKKEQNAGGQAPQTNYQHPQKSQPQQPPQYDEPPMSYDDDIPFAPLCLQYPALAHCIC